MQASEAPTYINNHTHTTEEPECIGVQINLNKGLRRPAKERGPNVIVAAEEGGS